MFSDILKQAKVIPVYKSGPKNLPSNYRPISLLSPVSKVFEKLLYVRLEKYFSLHNVITNQQFGFRKGYSTEMVITDLSDTLKQSIDEGYYTCCIFLELSKAFDTVNHKILLKKLQTYGIRGNKHNLLANYLSNRSQFCHFFLLITFQIVFGCCNHASHVTFLDLLFSPCMLQRLSFCCFFPFLVLSNYTVCYLCILFLC